MTKKKKNKPKENHNPLHCLAACFLSIFSYLNNIIKTTMKGFIFYSCTGLWIRKDFQTVICYSLITGLIMKSNFVKFCQMLSTDFKDNPKKSIALIFWIIKSQILSCISMVKPHLIIYCGFFFFFFKGKRWHSTWIMHLSKIHVGSNFDQMHKGFG